MKRYHLLTSQLFTGWLALMIFIPVLAQGGSGDLPPVPKNSNTKAKPTTATKSKSTTAKATAKPITAKEPNKVEQINFDQSVEGRIEAATAGRTPPNIYYQDFTFTATEDDLLVLELSSANAALKLEILDANKKGIPLLRDEQTGDYRFDTTGNVLPAGGEYRIRVSSTLNSAPTKPIFYVLKLNHSGLTAAGYQHRLQQIVKGFDSKNADETISQLERLANDDPNKPGAYEYLGLLYNEYKKNQVKASAAMLQAIKYGGAAVFKVTYDSRWRRANRDKKTGAMSWPEAKTNWLRITDKEVAIADFTVPDKILHSLTYANILDINRATPVAPILLVRHNNKLIKPEMLNFMFNSQVEVEMVIDLVKGKLQRKDN